MAADGAVHGGGAVKAAGVLTVAVVLALGAMHFSTVADMVGVWARSDTFAHGFLIVPISVWLLWRKRDWLAAAPIAPAPWGLALCAIGSLAWLAAAVVDLKSPAQFALVMMVQAAVLSLMGVRFFKAAMFPLMFLFFAPPAGEFLMPVMMEATAEFTTRALALSGVPVFREGLQFRIPSGQWSVVEACSGLRYLIASVVAGSLFAYLNFQSLRRRVLFVLASLAVPVIANWLRAYLIVMLGHFTDNRLAAGADHLVYGWVFFGVVMAVLFAIGMRFAEPDRAVPVAAARQAGARAPWSHALAVLSICGASPLALAALELQAGDIPPAHTLPGLMAGWEMGHEPVVWEPHWVGAHTVRAGTYRRGRDAVSVVVAHYPGGRGRPTSSENVLVKSADADWRAVRGAQHTVGDMGTLAESRIVGRGERLVAWSGFYVGGEMMQTRAWAAIKLSLARLTGRAEDAAWVVFYTREDAASAERLAAFVREAGLGVVGGVAAP